MLSDELLYWSRAVVEAVATDRATPEFLRAAAGQAVSMLPQALALEGAVAGPAARCMSDRPPAGVVSLASRRRVRVLAPDGGDAA